MNKAVLFVIFNRYDKAKIVFEQIRKAKPPRLYVVADGPRENNKDDIINCKKTREIIKEVDWQCDVKTLFREKNMQCGPSLTGGISWAFEYEEDLIILEDDCVAEEAFFYFCESLLDYYKDNEQIMSISGVNSGNYKSETASYSFFSMMSGIWGWATWKRVWKNYKFYIRDIYPPEDIYKKLNELFDDSNIINFWMHIYDLSSEGKALYEWSYQLHFQIIMNNGLSILPNENYVINIGTPECVKNPKKIKELLDNRQYHNIPNTFIHPEIKRSKYADYIIARAVGDEYIRICNNNIVESMNYIIETIIWFIPTKFFRNKLRDFFRKKVPLYK